jgi:prepilin-type N-terminal cleavage/methylation domain-containing protein
MKLLNKKNAFGFTLIEAIVVTVIMAILAVGLSQGIVKGVQNYFFANTATQLSQKAQVALARINKELIDATVISSYISSSTSQIDYTRPYSPPSCQQAAGCEYLIQWNTNKVYLQGISPAFGQQVLIDNVSTFTLTFTNYAGTVWSVEAATGYTVNDLAQISVNLILTYGSNQTLTFNTSINPRKGSKINAPKI